MSKEIIAVGLFLIFFLGLSYALPVTTFDSFQVSGTTDQNITLSCVDDVNGCKAINYNVNNEGWNSESSSSGAILDDFEDGSKDDWNSSSNLTLVNATTMQGNYYVTFNSTYTNIWKSFNSEYLIDFNIMFRAGNVAGGNVIRLEQSDGTVVDHVSGCGLFINFFACKDLQLTGGTGTPSNNTNYIMRYVINNGAGTYSVYFYNTSGQLLRFQEGMALATNVAPERIKLYYSNGTMGIDNIVSNSMGFDTNSYSFLYSGVGDHNIQYFSTDNADNNETTKFSYFPMIKEHEEDPANSRILLQSVSIYNDENITSWQWIVDGANLTGTTDQNKYYITTANQDLNVCVILNSTYSNCQNILTWDTEPPTIDANIDTSTLGFVSTFDIDYNMICYDNFSPINYQVIKNDTNILYDSDDVNASLLSDTLTLNANESAQLTFKCTDQSGNIATQSFPAIYALTFRLINETNGVPLVPGDYNGDKEPFHIKKIIAYTIDGNYAYDFSANTTTTVQMFAYDNALRFEINYNNAGLDLFKSKEIDFGLIDDQNIGVCVAPLQTFYEQRLTSIQQKQGYIYLPTAKCYALAGTLHYVYTSGYFNNTWTIDRPYELWTYISGVKTFSALINGGIESSHNLDALEFNSQGVNFVIGQDAIVFKPLLNSSTGVYDTNILQIYYYAFYQNNTSLDIKIYSDSNGLLTQITEDTNLNEFVLNWNWTPYKVTDENILHLVITTTVDGEIQTQIIYFNVGGDYWNQTLDPTFIAAITVLFFIFGLTIMSVGRTFGWWGIIVCIITMGISMMAPGYYWLTMIQGGIFICFLYILLSGGAVEKLGGYR